MLLRIWSASACLRAGTFAPDEVCERVGHTSDGTVAVNERQKALECVTALPLPRALFARER
jgi:hypothetical protein